MTARRVLWLTKGLGRGGAERLLTTSVLSVDRTRFEIEVAYLLPWKDALVQPLIDAGLKVHCLDQRREGDLRWVGRLRRLVRQRRFDIVHTHMPVSAAATRLAFPGRPPALVHTEHNLWSRYRLPTYWANALTYRRNDAVIAVSQAVADSVEGRFLPAAWQGEGVEVLHHGLASQEVPRGAAARGKARAEMGLDGDTPVIGTVGNLTAKKDHRGLLRALRLLVDTGCPAHLVLIGSGPLEGELRREVDALELGDRVLMLGSRDDVADLLPGFDIFCLSSRFEGLSIALVEALAAGVPAVATRVGGVPEVLTDGVEGRLVPPADPVALATALRGLLDDPSARARMAEAAVLRARAFDVGAAMSRIEDIYDQVLAERR